MDLQVNTTGKRFYEVPSALAAVLLEAFPQMFTRVEKKIQPEPNEIRPTPSKPTFRVGRNSAGLVTVFLALPSSETFQCIDEPDKAEARFKAAGYPMPADVAIRYRQMYERGSL
jgi:hypothetical protein